MLPKLQNKYKIITSDTKYYQTNTIVSNKYKMQALQQDQHGLKQQGFATMCQALNCLAHAWAHCVMGL